MDLERILYATDFSADSKAALPYASAFASATGATLVIVHVDDTTPGLVLGDVGYGYLPQIDEIAHEEYQQLLAVQPDSDQIHCEYRFLRGVAAEGILRVAEQERVGLIVIGTHGMSGIKRLLMGSVAEAVLRQAKCPVLTIKQPPEDRGLTLPGKQKVGKV